MRVVPPSDQAAATQTTAAGRPAGDWRDSDSLDWMLVATLRQEVADRLSQESTGNLLEDRAAQRERGWAIITDLLNRESTERVRAGQEAWTVPQAGRLGRAVHDAVFGLGRVQPLVDDDDVENIMIFGHDRVVLGLTGGRQVPGPRVADSDEELIEFLSFVANRSEVNARPFSPAHPRLHLRLDGGARLAAQAWVCPRPQVVIRRHRMQEVSLDDLVGLDALTPVAANFLGAVVRSGRSLVVSGAQGAGKTTVVRALCGQIPRQEVIATFETEYELHLHEMTDRHPLCYAYEARPGSGELGPDGRRAGEVTLGELLFDSFRMNLDRQIVGEVRGPEAMAMLKAMQSGTGSISTTHAPHAVGAIEKLVTCVMEAGEHANHAFAVRAVSAYINVIVHVAKDVEPQPDGTARVYRYISEILVVTPGEKQLGYATTTVFKAEPGTRVATPQILPDQYRSLAHHGFDLAGYVGGQGRVE
ncbi:secretion protein [Serinicoccus sp. CNJ-927]|nr:secretion protein [Serinicoccus sp. CNJ-927]